MEKNKVIKEHRVGTVTGGLSLIATGILFVLHFTFKVISFEFILKLWPCILIGLGIELLVSNFLSRKFIYDKTAIFLVIIMTLFAMAMGAAELCLEFILKNGLIL